VIDATDLAADDAVESGEPPSQELHRELLALRAQIRRRYRCDRLLGDSPAARRIREQVRIAVESRARACIVGPSGSGREHLARTIHGGAQDGEHQPLLPLACSLLDTELLEAALLAFVRQSAKADAPPTVLLLDADQLTAECQESLVRMLVDGKRVVRTLATARNSLLQLAAEGTFRADLAAWLSPLVIELPALAARRQDLPVLAQLALEDFNALGEQQLSGFQPDALDALVAYAWPGNIDELHAVVIEACRKSAGAMVTSGDLPEAIRRSTEPSRPGRAEEPIELDKLLEDVEREVISRALRLSKGNKAQAARMLGVPRVRLLRRIEQLGIS
jgi:DNA-binding NtrC family response regulator